MPTDYESDLTGLIFQLLPFTVVIMVKLNVTVYWISLIRLLFTFDLNSVYIEDITCSVFIYNVNVFIV